MGGDALLQFVKQATPIERPGEGVAVGYGLKILAYSSKFIISLNKYG